MTAMSALRPSHFLWRMDGTVAVIQLNRPDRKNPLTFESYSELRDTFRALTYADDVNAVVFLPNGGGAKVVKGLWWPDRAKTRALAALLQVKVAAFQER